MNPKISVCIVTNQIDHKLTAAIQPYLQHLNYLEICVGFNQCEQESIDSFSTKYPSLKVFSLAWQGYGATKNQLAHLASAPWILSIDSDEIADASLIKSILHLDLSNDLVVFQIKRVQQIGKYKLKHGSYGAAEWKNRLYNKQKATWNLERVHEDLVAKIDNTINVKVKHGALRHLTAESLAEVQYKNDHYAQLSAENMFNAGKKATTSKPLLAASMSFIKQYFFKKGILDGKIGFQLAQETARYAYLKYKKLIELHKSSL